LNDWLKQEFQERVGSERSIILIANLGKAFQMANLPVTEEMIKEEDSINKLRFDTTFLDLYNSFHKSEWNTNIEDIKQSINYLSKIIKINNKNIDL
jgi:hypothetical protein